MRFRVLGPIEVTGENGPLRLGGPKQRAVLAHLLVRANQTVPTEALIDQVWGDDPPESARNSLQSYVSHLRQALGRDRLESQTPGYVLHIDRQELDAAQFEMLVREARESNGHADLTAGLLRQALALWRGPPFADLAGEASLAGEIARLEELRLQAVEERIGADIAIGQHADAVGELEHLIRDHPLREGLWASLMIALYRSGRQAESLAAFQRARELLANQLGVDPSPELQRLQEQILRQDPDLELKGGPLRGYRLLEPVGEGVFGIVYRATQPQIGREVAIKAVHPALANHPDFVRRFEREAQIVARLEHPHIVPLYDYWREPDAAYLVMRFLRGGSLEALIHAGPLQPRDAARILDHVAAALSAAHRQGVIHRDVKPGNVLLDEEANAYLTDFGVALDGGVPWPLAGVSVRGTPACLSPEQIRLEPAGPGSDVYALGVVLFEMLTGAHPFRETSLSAVLDHHLRDPLPSVRDARPDLSEAVDDAIARATAKDPRDRFTDALELAATFRSAVEGTHVAREPVGEIRNPYKGLRAFLESDADDFFGREELVRRLVSRLGENDPAARFLAVVGPSGSGKSSVVRAGLVPALHRGALAGSDRWYVIDVLPGFHPLRELGSALLGVAVDPQPSLLEELERDELGLVRAVDRVLPDLDSELLIIVDQLEEVFTLVEAEGERMGVLNSLRAAALEPGSRIRVVTTLRADFFDEPLSIRGFGDLLATRTEAITPMSPEELERAIVAPAEHAGLTVEPRLLAAMIADVVDRPGALPLLQYALTELAERASDGVLTLDAYRRIGGASGALAGRAEQLFEALNETARHTCRQLFLRLVSLGEGSQDTRRRVRRSELAPLADATAMEEVVGAFGRHRLLSFDRDPASREPTLEIAHEALLGAWTRLRRWINEARDDIRAQRQLSAAAGDWQGGDRDPSFLLRGARLEQAMQWSGATTLALTTADREYLDACIQRRDEELAAERAVRERERALERRSIRRLRSLVTLGVAAALVATTLTVVAVEQRSRTQREATLASARELAAAAEANLDVDPERSVLLALQAVTTSRRAGAVLPEAVQALHDAVGADRLLLTLHDPSTANVAYSPDGRLLATGGTAGGLNADDALLWNARTGDLSARLTGHTGDIGSVAFNADGSRLVTSADDQRVIVWNTHTGGSVVTIDEPRGVPVEGSSAGRTAGASFSPDGRVVAIAGMGGIRLFDAGQGRPIMSIDARGFHCDPEFSPDGAWIVVGCATPISIWDARTGELAREIPMSADGGVVWSPDGQRLLTASDGIPTILDGRTGRVLMRFEGHSGEIVGLAWSPDGARIATGSQDGTARVWDAESGRSLLTLTGHAGIFAVVAFSPDGTRLLTGGGDGTARVWDVTQAGGAEAFAGLMAGDPSSVAFSPDGLHILTTDLASGAGWSWDASTGDRTMSYPDLWDDGAFGAEGTTVFGAGWSAVEKVFGTRILDVASGDELDVLETPRSTWPPTVAMSPDGALVASGTSRDEVILMDGVSGGRLHRFERPEGQPNTGVEDLAFSPDGRNVAAIDTRATLRVWTMTSGEELLSLQAQSGLAHAVTFSPDGKWVGTSGADGAAVWDATSGEQRVAFTGSGSVEELAFSPDGRLVATAGGDGTARVWDVTSGGQTLVLGGNTDALSGVAFSPDGTRLATVGHDGTLRVYLLGVDELIRLARARLTRGLTPAECGRYLHLTACPEVQISAPPTSGVPTTITPPLEGPEGAYRVTIVPADFAGSGLSPDDVATGVGDFTLSLLDGSWRLHQAMPSGESWDVSGTYAFSADRVTLTNRSDVWCFGTSSSARWTIEGMTMSLTDVSSTTTPVCEPELLDPWTDIIFGSRPWSRLAHHELGG